MERKTSHLQNLTNNLNSDKNYYYMSLFEHFELIFGCNILSPNLTKTIWGKETFPQGFNITVKHRSYVFSRFPGESPPVSQSCTQLVSSNVSCVHKSRSGDIVHSRSTYFPLTTGSQINIHYRPSMRGQLRQRRLFSKLRSNLQFLS